jgi:hypothetical protein
MCKLSLLVFLESFALVCGAVAPMPLDHIPLGRGLRGIFAHAYVSDFSQKRQVFHSSVRYVALTRSPPHV